MKVLKLAQRTIGKSGGFVRLVDISPRVIPTEYFDNGLLCDSAVVEAARVSYNSKKTKSDDISLIKYLVKNAHTSPFEMVHFKFHIKAPIFVVRQWQRHRMSSYNEISGRYSVMEDSFWKPEHFKTQGTINKQGSDGEIV
jgi:thymidylate synthase (FAD)